MNNKKLAAMLMTVLALLATGCHFLRNQSEAGRPDAPSGFYGGLDFYGTNVVLGWNRAPGPVAGYEIQHGVWNARADCFQYSRHLLDSNATFFVDVDAVSNSVDRKDVYLVKAEYPGGKLSVPDCWSFEWHTSHPLDGPPFGPAIPQNVHVGVDSTGTNVEIMWMPAPGPATNYIIVREATDPTNTDGYDCSLVATVDTNTLRFEAVGMVKSTNDLLNIYEVAALYPGNALSAFVGAYVDPSRLVVQPP